MIKVLLLHKDEEAEEHLPHPTMLEMITRKRSSDSAGIKQGHRNKKQCM